LLEARGAWGTASALGLSVATKVVVRDQILEKHVDNGSVSFLGSSESTILIANLSTVALLTTVSDTITARGEFAVGSATIWLVVRVSCRVIAFFVAFANSVSASLRIIGWVSNGASTQRLGGSGVLAKSSLESSELLGREGLNLLINEPADTFGAWGSCLRTNISEDSLLARCWQQFGVVDGGICGDLATSVGKASCGTTVEGGVGIIHPKVANLAICGIDDAITAVWKDTVQSAVIRNVGVGDSHIALLA